MSVESNGLVFIHIPKTGGTSVFTWMQNNLRINRIKEKHSKISDIGENKKYFCVVRNPYERLTSWYFFRIRRLNEEISKGKGKNIVPEFKRFNLSIEEALNEWYGQGFEKWLYSLDLSDPYKKIENSKKHYNPDWGAAVKQVDYISKSHKPLFVLKTENLNEDFKKIQKYYNCFKPLEHKNKSKTLNDINDYYTSDMKDYVYNYWKEDFEYFGYKR